MASLTSDLLRAGVGVVPAKLLESSSSPCNSLSSMLLNSRWSSRRKERLIVLAKIGKKVGKKHEYPWPDEIDPNSSGRQMLGYLSPFKPLVQKPKPVALPFEKPLMELEKKITEVRRMADETGLDFSDQIESLESKYQQALKDLYSHLTPIQRLSIARHPNRPTFMDHVLNITDKWVELHGDRAGYDDPAIVTGIGSIDGRSYMFIGQQKGRNTKENIQRNFGMPTPHGYRKALRMMYYADHHGFPIITFIDTPGAFADLKSEEIGQGEAIAHNLRSMFGLKVPIVTVVIGEGGSGGALAIGCANKLFMLENSVFFVASPEACAAILWKSSKAAPKAAEKLKITSAELCKLNIADGVIPEPLGGAHMDPSWTSHQIKAAVVGAMDELLALDTQKLLDHRMLKFRKIGGFIEGEPVDPSKKVNMKKKEEPNLEKLQQDALDLDLEVEKLKQQMTKSKEDPSEPLNINLVETFARLKKDVDQEFYEAVKSMGLSEKLEMLRQEVLKARSSPNKDIDPNLIEEIEKVKQKFKEDLSKYPNIENLNLKLDMLKEVSKAQKLSKGNERAMSLKEQINNRFKEIMNRSDLKEKIDKLKAEITGAGASNVSDLDNEMKNKVMELKREMESELAKALNSLDLEVEVVAPKGSTLPTDILEQPLYYDLKEKIDELNYEIQDEIGNALNSNELRSKIEMLRLEMAKVGKAPDSEALQRLEALKQEIKQNLVDAISSPSLVEKHETLKEEITSAQLALRSEMESELAVVETF